MATDTHPDAGGATHIIPSALFLQRNVAPQSDFHGDDGDELLHWGSIANVEAFVESNGGIAMTVLYLLLDYRQCPLMTHFGPFLIPPPKE